ncbi:MAG: FMN-binding protein, partial [Gammaproteobacteria bacterium]|nr:FMN-binding protein [Gammaproteobacteria bacterium]
IITSLAWVALLAAFIIGQIAGQTDYETLLQQQMPDIKLQRSSANTNLPIVYNIESDQKQLFDALVMAEGTGYGGPLIVAIKARRTDDGANLNEIIVLSHKETPAFMDRINTKFFRQFAGKSVTDNYIVDDDIDAVSGATVSAKGFTTAIREAVHLGAIQHLKLPQSWQEPVWKVGLNEMFLIILFALAFYGAYQKGKIAKAVRLVVVVASIAFVGFYANASVNLGNIAGIFMGYIPNPREYPLWWIMMVGMLGSVVILGRNIYCQQICPFKGVQDLLQKISGVKLRIDMKFQRRATTLIYSLSWVALMLIFLSTHPALGSYEPFAMMFSLDGLGIQWYILPAAILGSFFVPSFWCRLFCPVGLYLNEMVRLRKKIVQRITSKNEKGDSQAKKRGE